MSDLNVKNALVGGVVAANIGIPTHYENAPNWTTPTNSAWARVQILSIGDEVLTFGKGGRNRREGLMRITVFTPKGSGLNTNYSVVDDVRSTLASGAELSHNGQVVRIDSAETRNGTDEEAWFSRIIDVNFYTYETRGI